MKTKRVITLLDVHLSICRLGPSDAIPEWASGISRDFISMTRTKDELSIVCSQTSVPEGVQSEGDWRALKIEGPLDFSLIGVLSSLIEPLAQSQISVFVISTFDTDYILVKGPKLEEALSVLEGCCIIQKENDSRPDFTETDLSVRPLSVPPLTVAYKNTPLAAASSTKKSESEENPPRRGLS